MNIVYIYLAIGAASAVIERATHPRDCKECRDTAAWMEWIGSSALALLWLPIVVVWVAMEILTRPVVKTKDEDR